MFSSIILRSGVRGFVKASRDALKHRVCGFGGGEWQDLYDRGKRCNRGYPMTRAFVLDRFCR